MEKAIQIHRLYHTYTLIDLYEELENFGEKKNLSPTQKKKYVLNKIINVIINIL